MTFWDVENYLWNEYEKYPPNSELRNWYGDGWWSMAYNRPKGTKFKPYKTKGTNETKSKTKA